MNLNAEELVERGLRESDIQEKRYFFQAALQCNPHNSIALIQLGALELHNPNYAISLFEKALDEDSIPKVSIESYQGQLLAGIIARYNIEQLNYKKGIQYIKRILSSESNLPNIAQQIQLATLVTGYPESIEDASDTIRCCNERMDQILKLKNIDLSYVNDDDPYVFCMLSMFNLEIYYECDIKSLMYKYFLLSVKAFPELLYKHPYFIDKNDKKDNIKNQINTYHIGIASAFFNKDTSVLCDFQGVIDRLPRGKYKITFIYFNESNTPSEYLEKKENVLIFSKNDKSWLNDARNQIGDLNLDLLLYLDSTMSSMCQRALISKLAKVQVVSHGHPITSGVDQEIMNYYVSWGAAELEHQEAQKHYTENLILLPSDTMHQYYQPRVKNNISQIDNISFDHIKRSDFGAYLPSDGNWYLCMQKPFKRHPEFDFMLKDILDRDPRGRILLHDGGREIINEIIVRRLRNTGIDMNRVHLIPVQPHHTLMALYRLSDVILGCPKTPFFGQILCPVFWFTLECPDCWVLGSTRRSKKWARPMGCFGRPNVILDSYYAGGCTTTREAFEVGGVVVTLPGKYLGGRWSMAYYNIIGVNDMIAKDKSDYVNISVKLGTDKNYNREMKKKILENVTKLFYSEEAVQAWDQALEKMIQSP